MGPVAIGNRRVFKLPLLLRDDFERLPNPGRGIRPHSTSDPFAQVCASLRSALAVHGVADIRRHLNRSSPKAAQEPAWRRYRRAAYCARASAPIAPDTLLSVWTLLQSGQESFGYKIPPDQKVAIKSAGRAVLQDSRLAFSGRVYSIACTGSPCLKDRRKGRPKSAVSKLPLLHVCCWRQASDSDTLWTYLLLVLYHWVAKN